MTAGKEWIVSAMLTAPGRMKICFYEKHAIGEPGLICCKELDMHEMEKVCEVAFKACMFNVRTLTP
jgi:hypothetical protein